MPARLTLTQNGRILEQHSLQTDALLHIAAQDNVYYQLDGAANVHTARQGNDLLLTVGNDG